MKALMIFFFLFVYMNYLLNQYGKVLEETLASLNLDDVETILRRLRHFKMTLFPLQVLQKSLPIPVFVCHTQ